MLAAVLAALMFLYMSSIYLLSNVLGLSARDKVAAVLMGSQKTMAFGLPLITALFAGSPDLVWLCLPILLYHPMQIVAGSVLVPRLR